jgi:hypothetical protein
MALRDEFQRADVLDSLSWVGMTLDARVAKLASLYLKEESAISGASRRYKGPTYGTVGVFVRSLLTPARGEGKLTYERVLDELPRQRKIQEDRAKTPAWKWTKRSVKKRRNAVAAHRFTIWETDWRKRKTKTSPNCVGITKFADATLIVDGGGYSTSPRIWMLDRATKKEKVVVLEGDRLSSINGALLRLTPKKALRGALSGWPIRFDFIAEAFEIDGELVPWKKVRRIYHGDQVHHTEIKPKREVR